MNGRAAQARIRVARALAEALLAGLPERWRHTVGVARRATELAVTVDPDDRSVLVVAAWLHDIGYARTVSSTGFHALDGAAYLDRHGWPRRVSALVAHHSGARFVASAYGLDAALGAYPVERSAVSDALTYADQTVGPGGQPMPLDERMSDMLVRHGSRSPQARVHPDRAPHLRAAGRRVERRLAGPDTS